MDGNFCSVSWLPSSTSPPIIHHITSQVKHHSHQHSLCKATQTPLAWVPIPCFWPCLDSRQHDVFLWASLPPCVYLLSTLCNPIGLQCTLFLLSEFPEVHSFYTQLPSHPHRFCFTSRGQCRLRKYLKDLKGKVRDWVLMHDWCFRYFFTVPFPYSAFLPKGHKT